ncbi:MAG TPA: hypothetical protein PKD50_10845 [Leptospiraceae bacterium]|nr:hypothetical protein [Leptospiraceae bacterium]
MKKNIIKLILLSLVFAVAINCGKKEEKEEAKTTQAGCDLYLSKPIKKQTLLDCLFSLKVTYLNE